MSETSGLGSPPPSSSSSSSSPPPPPPRTLLLATRNPHKLRELGRLLAPGGMAVEGLAPGVTLPPEDGETFADNALPKARAAAAASGRPAVGDDSGICADALGGQPGVRSARFAGPDASDEENLVKLLALAPAGSALHYVCALAYVDPVAGVERVFHGACSGRLAVAPSGAGGFGYDPAFVPDGEHGEHGERTMAELSDAEKDAISHRGLAVRELLRWLTAPTG